MAERKRSGSKSASASRKRTPRARAKGRTGELFIEAGGQLRMTDKSAEQVAIESGRVECLGVTFDSEDARRQHFMARLREKLNDPEFRKIPGFPVTTDEDILRLSDPPYFTACPNPFLEEFVRHHARPFDPAEVYRREPFAVDVSVGKTDPLYKAHAYHTKVPHLAMVPSILHYTRPGDIVLDGFAGSGMTGVAAQWCESAPRSYRQRIEQEWKQEGRPAPEWGARRVVLNDLGPAATFIAANYNLPFDVRAFTRKAQRILDDVERELGWMYETLHTDWKTKARINYTVWSQVFSCPECSGEVVFLDEALDEESKRVRDEFPCPSCGATLSKDNLEPAFETTVDPATEQPWKRVRFRPSLIQYTVGKKQHEKAPDNRDLAVLDRVVKLPSPAEVPRDRFPIEQMYHGSRLAPKGFSHVHHMFLPRAAQALGSLWRKAATEPDTRLRNILLFFVEQAIWGMSVLALYTPTHYSQVNQYLTGVYYVASQIVDVSPWYILAGKLSRLSSAFARPVSVPGTAAVTTGTCAALAMPDISVDYVFTDPPFGANIFYADLNFLVEAWHRVRTDAAPEAIVDQPKKKGLHEYQELMTQCFTEYCRVLKPGRWMTVVFHNSSNAVWNAIQEAMLAGGFVVAEQRAWDKHEQTLELRALLDQNFLAYPGTGPIPEPLWTWMQKSSSIRPTMKDQTPETANAQLRNEVKDRWYVPDPNRATDLEKIRERALLKDFDTYRQAPQKKLRSFRLEAVRTGFRAAWATRDYATILAVADKMPEEVLQEDPQLLMWYDQALARSGAVGGTV